MIALVQLPNLNLPDGFQGILLIPAGDSVLSLSLGEQLLEGNDLIQATLLDPSRLYLDTSKWLEVTGGLLNIDAIRKRKKSGQKKEKDEINLANSEGLSSDGGPSSSTILEQWNRYATKNGWTKMRIISKEFQKRYKEACRELNRVEMWETVLRGLEADEFFGGASGKYKTQPMTLFFKNRYMDFYNAGLDLEGTPQKQSVQDIVNSLAELATVQSSSEDICDAKVITYDTLEMPL